jgi:hypothetical protein
VFLLPWAVRLTLWRACLSLHPPSNQTSEHDIRILVSAFFIIQIVMILVAPLSYRHRMGREQLLSSPSNILAAAAAFASHATHHEGENVGPRQADHQAEVQQHQQRRGQEPDHRPEKA